MKLLRRIPLTPKLILLTIAVGFLSFGMLEYIHNQRLKVVFEAQLNSQLALQAQEARVRFDSYVDAYRDAVEVTVTQRRFTDYIEGRDFKVPGKIRYYDEIPPWMPPPSVIRRLVRVSYAILIDGEGVIREIYQGIPEPLPPSLLRPDDLLKALSSNQSFMTRVDGIPFVITANHILDAGRRIRATLMFARSLSE